jgi:hypothetical protein
MLPAQFFARRTSTRVEGEMRLLIAVLEDAINTYVRCMAPRNHRQREELREVEAWFEGHGQSGLFAFENVCELLGVEAGRLREWVRSSRASRTGARHDGGKWRTTKWRAPQMADLSRRPGPQNPRSKSAPSQATKRRTKKRATRCSLSGRATRYA